MAAHRMPFGKWLVLGLGLVSVACTMLQGCSINVSCATTSGSQTTRSGQRFPDKALTQVQIGKTTGEWLLAAAGRPTSRVRVDEHTELIRYEYTESTSKSSVIPLIWSISTRGESRRIVCFELSDGVVRSYWQEDFRTEPA